MCIPNPSLAKKMRPMRKDHHGESLLFSSALALHVAGFIQQLRRYRIFVIKFNLFSPNFGSLAAVVCTKVHNVTVNKGTCVHAVVRETAASNQTLVQLQIRLNML